MDDESSAFAHHHCCREGCAARGSGTRACVFVCYDRALKDGEPRHTSPQSSSSHHHVAIHSEQCRTVDDDRENYFLPVFLTGQSEFLRTHSVTSALLSLIQAGGVLALGGLSWWYHARLGSLHTLMHFCLHVWCQYIMRSCLLIHTVHCVCIHCSSKQTSVRTLHAWMHKVYVFTVVVDLYKRVCAKKMQR